MVYMIIQPKRRSYLKNILLAFLVFIVCLIIGYVSYKTVSRLVAVRNAKSAQHITKNAQNNVHVEQKTNTTNSEVANAEPSTPKFVPDYSLPAIVNGLDPVVTTIDTKQPIVFLGIDDGAFKDPSVVQIMKQNHIKASLFLSKEFIASNPDFFKQLIDEGSLVEDHTLTHDTTMVWDESYAQQKAEICGMADYEQQHYGRRPILFRPPGGSYSTVMQKAAYACGMRAMVTWIAKANGGSMQYQIGNKLRAGDVVLMHFRPVFKQDMQAFVDAENAAGLRTERIEDAIQ
jgi:peptidoglycan/xylan/chitin deacetylase (PgdA/CDA1 family)